MHREGEDETDDNVKLDNESDDGAGQRRLRRSRDKNNGGALQEGDATIVSTRRSRQLSVRRRLAKEVEQGVKSARLDDPDIDAKDRDIRLLKVRFGWTFVTVALTSNSFCGVLS